MQARPILLVDDYPLQRTFSLLVKRRTERELVYVKTFDDAASLLERPFSFCGLLLDIELSKELGAPTGFDLLAQARQLEPRIPAAMLTGHLDVELVVRAAELGAFYIPKPATMEKLEHFFVAAVAYDGDGTLDAAVDRVLAQIRMEPERAAARVLRLHAHGLSPEEVQERLDITLNTYKGNCRELLQISGRQRVMDVVREVWQAFTGNAPARDE